MFRNFVRYISQSVAGMIGISIYILADTFFISLCNGSDGLTMLNLVLPLYGLIFAIGAMLGIGSATLYGIKKAANENTDYFFLQSLHWCILISTIFILLGVFAPETVLNVLGADKDIVSIGRNYTRIMLIFSPAFMMNYTFTGFVRNDNAPTVAMAGSLIGSCFNIVFDYILMFPVGMGLAGAALATALSPIVTMSICCVHFAGKNNNVGFKIKRLSFSHLWKVCSLGVSAFINELSSAVTTIVFNFLILGLAGNIGVAAYGVVANIALVANAFFNGIAQGVQPIFSNSYGRGEKREILYYLKTGIIFTLIVEAVVVISIWFFTDSLIAIFNNENNIQLLLYARDGLRFYSIGFFIAGINIFLLAYFAATNNTKPVLIGSLLRGVIAISGFAVIFSAFGMGGIWFSFTASELFTFIIIFFKKVVDKTKLIV